MKFDYIIQNPPYSGSLHLEFLQKGFELLSDTGQMCIIEPSKWLIDVRKNERSKAIFKYNDLKRMLTGYVTDVVIENYNVAFDTGMYVPFSIVFIDKSNKRDYINYCCFGDESKVYSLYDCNLIGKYDVVWSILDKVKSYGDMMNDHIYSPAIKSDNIYFCKYAEIVGGGGGSLCGTVCSRNGLSYDSPATWTMTSNGEYAKSYTTTSFHHSGNEISNKILCRYNKGGRLTDEPAECLYGSKEELENWKYFIFNNKLPLFLNIVLVIDQHNTSKDSIPWLTDKRYTDDEINKLFKLSSEEIELIDRTIKKYERNSSWFRRYITGPENTDYVRRN